MPRRSCPGNATLSPALGLSPAFGDDGLRSTSTTIDVGFAGQARRAQAGSLQCGWTTRPRAGPLPHPPGSIRALSKGLVRARASSRPELSGVGVSPSAGNDPLRGRGKASEEFPFDYLSEGLNNRYAVPLNRGGGGSRHTLSNYRLGSHLDLVVPWLPARREDKTHTTRPFSGSPAAPTQLHLDIYAEVVPELVLIDVWFDHILDFALVKSWEHRERTVRGVK